MNRSGQLCTALACCGRPSLPNRLTSQAAFSNEVGRSAAHGRRRVRYDLAEAGANGPNFYEASASPSNTRADPWLNPPQGRASRPFPLSPRQFGSTSSVGSCSATSQFQTVTEVQSWSATAETQLATTAKRHQTLQSRA